MWAGMGLKCLCISEPGVFSDGSDHVVWCKYMNTPESLANVTKNFDTLHSLEQF